MNRIFDILQGEEPVNEVLLEKKEKRRNTKIKELEVKPLF